MAIDIYPLYIYLSRLEDPHLVGDHRPSLDDRQPGANPLVAAKASHQARLYSLLVPFADIVEPFGKR